MANVSNYGLIGVGQNLKFSKGGVNLQTNGSTSFTLAQSDGSTPALLNSGSITLSGNTTISSPAANITTISGTGALVVPSGTTGQEPTPATYPGGFRYNTSSGTMEYSNGSAWVTMATGGTAVTAVSVATANGLAGTSSGGTTPTLTLSTTVTGILQGNGTAISAATTTGSGAVVLATSPSLTTPDLGTPSSVVLTNATGLPLTTGVTGVLLPANGGTGVDNGSSTITLGGNLTTSGAFASTFTMTGTTSVTFPTSGTLLSTANIGSNAVTSISFGSTGLTPATATSGAVTVAGTLAIANGGTGQTSASAAFDALAPTTTAGDLIYFNGTTNTNLAIGSTGQALVVGAGEPTWANVVNSITGSTGITPSSGTGAVTLTLSSNLQSISGLNSTGFVVQTGTGTFTERDITGTAGNIVVTNGDGVASSPTIDLAIVTQGSGANFVKISLDGFGRVTGNTAVSQSDLTGLLGTYYLPTAGGTMTGGINMGGNAITSLASPTAGTDAVNKAYVDALVAGLTWKDAVQVATTTAGTLATSFTAGTVIDGYTLVLGDRILIKNQASGVENGIYIVTAGTPTRSTDMATGSNADNTAMFVENGTTQGNTGWIETATPAVVGTNALTFTQFSGGTVYTNGTGISITGNVISVNYGAGIKANPTNDVGINLYGEASSGLILTTDGSTRSDTVGAGLALLLPSGGGLTQDATGLYIPAAGVTNAMLANSSINLDADSGTGTVSLGGTLLVHGTSNRITTGLSGATFSVDIASTYVGQTSINTLGIVSTGTWNGTIVGTTYGGTGVNASGATDGELLIGNGTGGFTLGTLTAGTGISITNGAGSITVANTGVTSVDVSGGSTGLTFSGGPITTTGTITMAGTLDVANGGTGLTSVTAGYIPYGAGTSPLATSANFTFNGTGTLVVDGLTVNGALNTITASTGDLTLNPGLGGSVVVGPGSANGTVASESGQSLTVSGDTGLTLSTTSSGNIALTPASGGVVTVGTSLQLGNTSAKEVLYTDASNNVAGVALTNGQLLIGSTGNVPAAATLTAGSGITITNGAGTITIASTSGTGAVATVAATFNFTASTPVTIGTIPANATILQVKMSVATADTGSALVSVGDSTNGVASYMATSENDPQVTGLYVAEAYVPVGASAVTAIATISGTAASGSCTVIVEYIV